MKRINVVELLRLYDSTREKSVRWEGLQTYSVPWEDQELAAWQRASRYRRTKMPKSTSPDCGGIRTPVGVRCGSEGCVGR